MKKIMKMVNLLIEIDKQKEKGKLHKGKDKNDIKEEINLEEYEFNNYIEKENKELNEINKSNDIKEINEEKEIK